MSTRAAARTSAGQAAERELRFPADAAGGELTLSPRRAASRDEWVTVPASGTIRLGAGVRVGLTIPGGAALARLKRFDAGTFESIALRGANDDDLAAIARFAGLRNLVVLGSVDSRLTDAGLRELGSLHRLEHLYIDRLLSPDRAALRDWSFLGALPKLRSFMLAGGFRLPAPALVQLARLPLLRDLYLSDAGLTSEAIRHLRGMTGLRELGLPGHAGISDGAIAHLLGLERLESLQLWGTSVTTRGANRLALLRRLARLDLGGTRVDDGIAPLVRRLPHLCELGLREVRIGRRLLMALRAHGSLRRLDLSDTTLGDAGLALLAGPSRLEALDLRGTRVTDAGMAAVAGMRRLRQLDVRETAVGEDGRELLRRVARLEFETS